MLSSVSFSTGSEAVNESAGTFSIPVTLSGRPTGSPTVSTFASGFNSPAAWRWTRLATSTSSTTATTR